MAALYSAQALSLRAQPFYAFHVSGGTTECLSVTPHETGFCVEKIAGTLDLNAGQLVDRVGVMLEMGFPCGMELDRLAQSYEGKLPSIRVPMKGADCHFSGAQNQCEQLFKAGHPKEMVARYQASEDKSTIDGWMIAFGVLALLLIAFMLIGRPFTAAFEMVAAFGLPVFGILTLDYYRKGKPYTIPLIFCLICLIPFVASALGIVTLSA